MYFPIKNILWFTFCEVKKVLLNRKIVQICLKVSATQMKNNKATDKYL